MTAAMLFSMPKRAVLTKVRSAKARAWWFRFLRNAGRKKGARLSRALQFVGEYIVYHPYKMYVGASSRIEDKQKLEEYKRQVVEHTTGQEGWVLRTAAVTVPFAEIAAEMEKLRNDFEGVLKKGPPGNGAEPALQQRQSARRLYQPL